MPSSRARNATYSLRQRFATYARTRPGMATIMPDCVATSASLIPLAITSEVELPPIPIARNVRSIPSTGPKQTKQWS